MQICSTERLDKGTVRRAERKNWKPRNCVWELTLACNLRCKHCGSRAGNPLTNELSTRECLDLVRQLHELGCELITLSGGEPTLRDDWDRIARAISERNIFVNMVTNGVYQNEQVAGEIARRALDAGMCNIGVSIDGPRVIHEAIRGRGTFAKSISAIEQFVAAGMKVSVMTTVNKLNLRLLTDVRALAIEAGADMWRLQLAKPMGNMRDHDDLVIDPEQVLQLIPTLARLKKLGGITLRVGDSIGYYGVHEKTLRGWGWRGRAERWQGCQAGMQAIGIEADGSIKGCLSLQAKRDDRDPFVEGNVREASLNEIWYRAGAFAYNRDFDLNSLSGSCRGCKYDSLCRGGARCVSAALLGKVTEDPFCYYQLDVQHQVAMHPRFGQAATAAAAIALSMGSPGCYSSNEPEGDKTGASADAAVTSPGADAEADARPKPGPVGGEAIGTPDYGVEPPVITPVYGIEPPITPDYGIEPPIDASTPDDSGAPDDAETTVDATANADSGNTPPSDAATGTDATSGGDAASEGDATTHIDCSTVCCECEYGIIPPETYEACCIPDPCENVCCMCDYGIEPIPPECCK